MIVLTFFIELVTLCYIVPALIKLREATDAYIIDEDEPDCAVPDSYEKNLIKLCKLSRSICLVNLFTLIFLGANVYYLTSRLNVGNKI